MSQHTLIVLLQDHPGVLHRTASLLRRRQFNIVSLAVGRSEVPGVSRMTLVVDAEEATQVVKQLDRLVEVLAIHDVTNEPVVQRETALAKVVARGEQVAALVAMVRDYGARVLDLSRSEMIVEITDSPERVDAFIAHVRPHGITELMRTGRLAMMRGNMHLMAEPAFREQADGAGEEEVA